MTLEQNQITHLFIWVHPVWFPVLDSRLSEWKAFIELLAYEPHIGLVETRGLGPGGLSRLLGLVAKNRPNEYESERKHLCSLDTIEMLAECILGDRYLLWPNPQENGIGNGFVVGSNSDHFRLLAERFNIDERWQQNSITSEKKLFSQIAVYGLKPEVCVYHQAWNMDLHRLSSRIVSLGISPLGCIGRDYGIPSSKETLSFMSSRPEIFRRDEIERGREYLTWLGKHPWEKPLHRPKRIASR